MWKHSWRVLFACLVWDLMSFVLKLYFGKVPSHISYLCWFVNASLSLLFCIKHDVCHFFGILWAHFHFSVGIRCEQPAWPSNCSYHLQKCFIFFCLMVGYTHSTLWYLQSHTSSGWTLLSSRLSLIFYPEGICWGNTGSLWLTNFSFVFAWLLTNTVTMITSHSCHFYHETYQVIVTLNCYILNI